MSIRGIIVKAVPYCTLLWASGTWVITVGEAGVKFIPLTPDLRPSKGKGFKPPVLGLLPKPLSMATKHSFLLYSYRERRRFSLP